MKHVFSSRDFCEFCGARREEIFESQKLGCGRRRWLKRFARHKPPSPVKRRTEIIHTFRSRVKSNQFQSDVIAPFDIVQFGDTFWSVSPPRGRLIRPNGERYR